MKRFLLACVAGVLGAVLVVGLLAPGKPHVVAEEPTPEPTLEPTPELYVVYIPLVMRSLEVSRTYPVDWCSCAMYHRVASVEDGILCACASALGPEMIRPKMLYAGTSRVPSPYGGYGTHASRSFLLFPDTRGSGTPVLRASRVFVSGVNAARCWVDVHVFSLPPSAWTMPFTVTEEMWELVGPRLGSVVVEDPRENTREITLTIPLSGFSPTMVVLSRCETQHELCAINPYQYTWSVAGPEVVLEWQRDGF